MPDKQLLRLLGEDKRYIYRAVLWMLTGSLCSIGFTACLCYGLHLLLIDAKASLYLLPFVLGAVCAAVRFLATIRAASVRDRLGRSVKKSLRAQLYAKPAGTAVRKVPASRRAGDENREAGGADPTGHGGHRTAGSVLFFLPAAVFLCHALFGSLTLLCYPALYFKKKLDALS